MITLDTPALRATVALLLVLGALLSLSSVRGPIAATLRGLWDIGRAAWRRRRAFRIVEAHDPALAAEYRKLEAVPAGDVLVTRYCLVDRAGKKLEVAGMPGQVALYKTYGKALAHRQRHERVQRIRVPLTQLAPTLVKPVRDATGRRLLSVLALALLGCDGVALLAPMDAPPALTLCTAVVVDTLWIEGVPHEEQLHTCAPPSPDPTPPPPIGYDTTHGAVYLRGGAP